MGLPRSGPASSVTSLQNIQSYHSRFWRQNRDASAATLTAVPACQHPGSSEETREHAQRVLIASRPCSSAEKSKEQQGHGLHALSHFQSSWNIMQLADSNSHADLRRRKCGHAAVAITPTRPRAAARPTSRFLFFFFYKNSKKKEDSVPETLISILLTHSVSFSEPFFRAKQAGPCD